MEEPVLEKKYQQTSYGRIAYLEAGADDKPPVLFVHGIPTSSYLWRHVIRMLQKDFHCYAPDLMGLGDTDVDPETTPFHMDAQASMLEEFMTGLGHETFYLVCHDQGGAAAQILSTRRPERVLGLVITNAVCYDNWPVPVIAKLQTLFKLPLLPDLLVKRKFFHFVETRTGFSSFRRGVFHPERFSSEAINEYLRPLIAGEKELTRYKKFLMAGHPRYTMGVVDELKKFKRPTLIVWAADDHYISPSWGRKLFERYPRGCAIRAGCVLWSFLAGGQAIGVCCPHRQIFERTGKRPTHPTASSRRRSAMIQDKILLTTPTFPYPTLPWNDSMTDATGQRFTKGDGMFTVYSHTHCFANHILAQNVNISSVLLEYPRWEDFTAEVDKGYSIIGISAFPVHLDAVMKMCEYIRLRSKDTTILLGSYGGQAFEAHYDTQVQKKYVDHVVQGEGVRFLRNLLAESDVDRPISQSLMPKAGGTLPFVSKYPKGTVGFLVSGLGCAGGCDFCSTTALFKKKRIELLSPKTLVANMHEYYEHFPNVQQIFVVEEDHFRFPEYLHEMRAYWMEHPEMMERVDWFGFGSIDHIGKFAEAYGWDALAELGLGAIFIGVESKFAGEHGYSKRAEVDAAEVFSRLHSMGIRSIGAWICGWDWHDHNNIYEDLNYFVSLYPTYQQLTRLSPFPGTELWQQLKKSDRVMEVPWEDVHFWSGAQANLSLEPHETLNLTSYGYDLLYQTWGPSILRRLDVQLSGYAFCKKSSNPIIQKHKALFYKRQASLFWCFLRALDRYLPNGIVRRRARKIDEKYRTLIGEPTQSMKALASAVEGLATAFKISEVFDPLNRHPKEEPFKRYIYDKSVSSNGEVPYRTEMPTPVSLKVKMEMQREKLGYALMEKTMQAMQKLSPAKGDPEIDDYLTGLIRNCSFGFGF